MKQLTEDNYEQELQHNAKVIVKFYADWCPDCRRIDEKFNELATQYPDVVFASVDIEKQSVLKDTLAITSIPDIRFFVNGEEQKKIVEMNNEELEEAVTEFCSS